MAETETMRELFERLIKENPRFLEAPKSGQAVAIIGARPSGIKAADEDLDPRTSAAMNPKASIASTSWTSPVLGFFAPAGRSSQFRRGTAIRLSGRRTPADRQAKGRCRRVNLKIRPCCPMR
jgi:hypothetical protein